MKYKVVAISLLTTALFAISAGAAEMIVDMHHVSHEGTETRIGAIKAEQTAYGVLFTPSLSGLPPGLHGFQVHSEGNCEPMEKDGHMVAGLAAGGHFDPGNTHCHKGPYADGHLGDLPALFVDTAGVASLPVLAPRVKLTDLPGHSLIIHEGGDNYADAPKALGGGGARIACGVIGNSL